MPVLKGQNDQTKFSIIGSKITSDATIFQQVTLIKKKTFNVRSSVLVSTFSNVKIYRAMMELNTEDWLI